MIFPRFTQLGYKHIIKPILFRFDQEIVHDGFIRFGKHLGKYRFTRAVTRALFYYKHPILSQTIKGMHFANPIGLAAGFDKNAELINIIPAVGFSYMEVGSITGEYCEGNPKPRLWRLPKSESLLVYYGLKNDGAERIASRIQKVPDGILGISIAKTNSPDTVDEQQGIADYVKAYRLLKDKGNYITINISCPNAFGGEPFSDSGKLDRLLKHIFIEKKVCPIFIKLSPDISFTQLDEIIQVVAHYDIDGFICSNLTKKREGNSQIKEALPSIHGGLSGRVDAVLANKQIDYLYKKTQGKYILIGCGGVFCAEDAYEKIKAGASLIQLITGMIYEGPQAIALINKGLVHLLQQDGYDNVAQAVGANHR